uniref:non-specific serine/threonine protein kinase n=1 Tax=Arcella intermedia TaxID=1963864 RepID=A0A6B2L5B2_9EUKA
MELHHKGSVTAIYMRKPDGTLESPKTRSRLEGEKREKQEGGEKREKKVKIEDFELVSLLGKGSFGLVYLAKHIQTGKHCALKQIDKKATQLKGKAAHAKTEKVILTTAKSPFILRAVNTFQDEALAWLALEYCPGGDIKQYLRLAGCFEEPDAVLYFAEMILSVHDLHEMGYLHRDIKPDNFLIDRTGHIKLADFGLAKHKLAVGKVGEATPEFDARNTTTNFPNHWVQYVKDPKQLDVLYPTYNPISNNRYNNNSGIGKKPTVDRAIWKRVLGNSIVGTPPYMSPEVALGRHEGGSFYGEEIDWWSLGLVFFEMIFGSTPWSGDSPEELFKEIDTWNNILPTIFEQYKDQISPECSSLLQGFLTESSQRLGSDLGRIKKHPFFKGLDWSNLLAVPPPVVPNFDSEMTFLDRYSFGT